MKRPLSTYALGVLAVGLVWAIQVIYLPDKAVDEPKPTQAPIEEYANSLSEQEAIQFRQTDSVTEVAKQYALRLYDKALSFKDLPVFDMSRFYPHRKFAEQNGEPQNEVWQSDESLVTSPLPPMMPDERSGQAYVHSGAQTGEEVSKTYGEILNQLSENNPAEFIGEDGTVHHVPANPATLRLTPNASGQAYVRNQIQSQEGESKTYDELLDQLRDNDDIDFTDLIDSVEKDEVEDDDAVAQGGEDLTDEDDWTLPAESELDSTQQENLAASTNPPKLIPNEATQIESLLQQIGNHRVTGAAHELRWSLDDAIMAALAYSNRVSSLRIESTEALQNVGIEYGQFDVAAFVEQSFQDSTEPVGSSIDTASGVQEIIQEQDFNIAYGLRRQLRSGGDFEISQSYQIRDNDSGILIPRDQAISRLNGRITKELLRGAGRSIAMNQVLVARHDASAQKAESVAGIADHLNEVMTAYWDIFAARGALLASMENRQLAIEVLKELNARQDVDAEPNLIDQSEATIRQRELDINQAHSDLIRAQIQFISLVNAPELLDNSNNLEILPQVTPDLDDRQLDIASRVNTAIQRRPEIDDIIQQIKSAQVVNHLSLNELLPRLSLSLDASLNGLEGDRELGDAIGNQFENDVTYQVGADFEVPLANRRARFNKRRTELVVARLRADWQGLIQQVKADVLDNAQEFSATQTRLQTQREVLRFTARELSYLALRKSVAPKESDNVSFALTQVLSAQDRQVTAKTDFIAAIADKHRAIFELNRATGILINSDVIPQDGVLVREGFFSVYHQFIEDKGSFEGPLAYVEAETRAKSPIFNQQIGVEYLNLDSPTFHSLEPQLTQSVSEPEWFEPGFEQVAQPFQEVIHAGANQSQAGTFVEHATVPQPQRQTPTGYPLQ